MKKMLIIAASALLCVAAQAQEQKKTMDMEQQVVAVADDFQIVSDEIVDGIRCVTAYPSAKVCSRQIDIRIKDGIIQSVVYTRGCDGNAKGIGALIKDMSVEEAIRRLDGINCGRRGTSCPDQLARILKALK